jgi:hypothetical protein
MILKHMKRVTFLCPAMTTGGPEAIHQAAQVLNEQGCPSDIAYYGGDGTLTVRDGRMEITPPTDNPCLTAYAEYEPIPCRSALLRPHHLIVLPEVLTEQLASFGRAGLAVWWLSVDNSPVATDPALQRVLAANRGVKHLYQSAYAADFLHRLGLAGAPLGDFTTAEFTAHGPTGPNSEPAITFNPAKGADLAAAFFAAHPSLSATPIRGMSRVETAQVFRRALTYVDFGHLPGKDRLPREAAASGTIVFLRNQGAGRFDDDFPVPDFFRFTEDDVASGELFRRILAVQEDAGQYWHQQQPLRDRIHAERDTLREEVRRLLGRAPGSPDVTRPPAVVALSR